MPETTSQQKAHEDDERHEHERESRQAQQRERERVARAQRQALGQPEVGDEEVDESEPLVPPGVTTSGPSRPVTSTARDPRPAATPAERANEPEAEEPPGPQITYVRDAAQAPVPLPKKRLDYIPAGKRAMYVVDGRVVDPNGNAIEGYKWNAETRAIQRG